MNLRTRLNLVVGGLAAVFVAVLIAEEIKDTRSSVREEIEAANGVASQLLGRLALRRNELRVVQFRHVDNDTRELTVYVPVRRAA